jgi:hypothetical protein
MTPFAAGAFSVQRARPPAPGSSASPSWQPASIVIDRAGFFWSQTRVSAEPRQWGFGLAPHRAKCSAGGRASSVAPQI